MGLQRNIKNFQIVSDNLYRSGLPNGKDLSEIKDVLGLDTVIDLSDRPRQVVKNWCIKNGVKYVKIPINEEQPDILDFERAINSIEGKTLVHCFRGIHRTGTFFSLLRVRNGADAEKEKIELHFKIGITHPNLVNILQ